MRRAGTDKHIVDFRRRYDWRFRRPSGGLLSRRGMSIRWCSVSTSVSHGLPPSGQHPCARAVAAAKIPISAATSINIGYLLTRTCTAADLGYPAAPCLKLNPAIPVADYFAMSVPPREPSILVRVSARSRPGPLPPANSPIAGPRLRTNRAPCAQLPESFNQVIHEGPNPNGGMRAAYEHRVDLFDVSGVELFQ
jgi:hypothetical protein